MLVLSWSWRWYVGLVLLVVELGLVIMCGFRSRILLLGRSIRISSLILIRLGGFGIVLGRSLGGLGLVCCCLGLGFGWSLSWGSSWGLFLLFLQIGLLSFWYAYLFLYPFY